MHSIGKINALPPARYWSSVACRLLIKIIIIIRLRVVARLLRRDGFLQSHHFPPPVVHFCVCPPPPPPLPHVDVRHPDIIMTFNYCDDKQQTNSGALFLLVRPTFLQSHDNMILYKSPRNLLWRLGQGGMVSSAFWMTPTALTTPFPTNCGTSGCACEGTVFMCYSME